MKNIANKKEFKQFRKDFLDGQPYNYNTEPIVSVSLQHMKITTLSNPDKPFTPWMPVVIKKT